jgi:CBS domain-containing protein
VAEVMTPDPVTTREGADVADVAHLLADTGWKSLPVVDTDGVLVGMISRSDVIRALSTSDAEIWLHVVRDFGQVDRPEWDVSVTRGVVTLTGVAPGRDARLAAAIAATAPGVRGVVVATPAEDGARPAS